MEIQTFHYDRLIKSEDLNHHGTLFAGRCSEWFVDAGFIAVASVLPPNNIVCLQIHGLTFSQPISSGEIACFESKMVQTGRTSLKVYVTLKRRSEEEPIVKGFITFVHIDENGKAIPHGLDLELTDSVDLELNRQAKILD